MAGRAQHQVKSKTEGFDATRPDSVGRYYTPRANHTRVFGITRNKCAPLLIIYDIHVEQTERNGRRETQWIRERGLAFGLRL